MHVISFPAQCPVYDLGTKFLQSCQNYGNLVFHGIMKIWYLMVLVKYGISWYYGNMVSYGIMEIWYVMLLWKSGISWYYENMVLWKYGIS